MAIPVSASSTTTYSYNDVDYSITLYSRGNTDTVTVKSVEGTSIVKINKKTNELEMVEKDENGKQKQAIKINLNENDILGEYNEGSQITTQATFPIISSGNDILCGHDYTVYDRTSNYSWWLHSHGVLKVKIQDSSNVSTLQSFRNSVNSCASNVVAAIAAAGVSVVSAIIAIILALPTAGIGTVIALLVSLGAALAAAPFIFNAYLNSKDADYYFAIL